METKREYYASVKHFAYALFVYYRGEDEAYKAILEWLDYEECLTLIRVVAKCLMVVFKERYENFFKANGGLIGMRKYFDQIKHEDMRHFIYRHAKTENKSILIPTFSYVLNIVKHFDEEDFRDFDIDLPFFYKYYDPDEKKHVSTNKLKYSLLSFYLLETDVKGESKEIEGQTEEEICSKFLQCYVNDSFYRSISAPVYV
ncbi:hypothetical protein CDAR_230001 [Caerostris darwini]|uniref:Uncharacterized protein n=1 Tax=Caerostris darwini TaxID=1538125 RepID=A0AAV4VD44_9ARAC|nr:hypothetical protein CDAR_230001 [Caerostris darwini]